MQTVTKLEQIGEWLTLREAARQLGTSKNALYIWLRKNDKSVTRVGHAIVVRREDIAGYEARYR